MTQRDPHWPDILQATINEHRDLPFKWGSHDCALWAAKVVQALTGNDLGADWSGHYKTARGAVMKIRKMGFTDPASIADHHLGERKPVSMAGQGDIVACDLAEHGLDGHERQIGLTLGVCNGPLSYFVTEDGLIALPTLALDCAWTV